MKLVIDMNSYPESLHNRCTYLERENEKLKTALTEVCAEKDIYIHSLRLEVNKLREFIDRDKEYSRLWVWQGDGYDFTRSMSNDLPVLITGAELRDLLKSGEVVADEGMPSWNTHSWQQVFFFEGKWFGTNAEWDFQMHITDGFKGAYVSLLKDHGDFICEGTFDGDWKKSLMKRPIIKGNK